ncbi:MAG: Sec-independent protein translocase protein tatA/E-like protein [Firmicutes bacterium]|nr:Sec-independent protein translocase protein tatA/E-like protein [Bacillota bacterium]
MWNVGMTELVLILIIALVVFGPSKLPDIGKAIGKSIREFKSATEGEKEDKPTMIESTKK